MPGSFKNKLFNHEVLPPASVWEKIAGRLDAEFYPADHRLSSRMEKMEVAPPPGSFERILSELPQPAPVRTLKPAYRRIAVAAAVAAAIALTTTYFFNSGPASQDKAVTTPAMVVRPPATPEPVNPASQAPGAVASTRKDRPSRN